ncbi:hypothetical protein F2P56_024280 [Juglans regia]|uniref:RNase H type-1 domain-containing protein n=2 Tax=Juglans regia TaxID=51240 RepID=A0A833X9C5_JUGRE|nr:uncharacterized protein LOC109005485 [Juglans regia]KAF5454630.1 hypothetical protein F2P56_024280 [Juglans regia]
MWKDFTNSLSVDVKLHSVGIPIVCKCDCCSMGGYEDLNHVLAIGNFAKELLNRYVVPKVRIWGQLLGLLPVVITWLPWLRRYRARVEGISESINHVWMQLKYWSAGIGDKLKSTKQQSVRDIKILKDLQVHVRGPKQRSPCLVHWSQLIARRMKLNVDGGSRGNPGPAGVEGVLRDLDGNVKMAFSVSLGNGTNNFAKLLGLLHGIQIDQEQGFVDLDVELDFWVVVHWIKEKRCNTWYFEDFWEEVMEVL